ncbi:delta-60 repeat domain-containing protein [Pseudomonas moraviensis]|uniref:delta-60 repeat domain-containing protein n=1 Tax=Pseudomonas moraviensis TaxID=321662 RepID=UPI00105AA152|nr:delta-60 repeat domain-containing protein [Pseudomonas moraviensis]TDK55462.1 hypothetical protein E1508_08310 [Pseudomonas moraviensis]
MTEVKTTALQKLDPTFGPDKKGLVWLKYPDQENGFANAITVAADGKLLIAANAGNKFAIVRLTPDGTQDTSFSGDGVASGVFAKGYKSTGGSISILKSNNLLLQGAFVLNEDSSPQRGLAMFRNDGTPKTGFGDKGVVIIDPFRVPALAPSEVAPAPKSTTAADYSGHAIEVADGKLMVLSNHRYSPNDQCGLLIRLQSNGALDTTFGQGQGYVAIRYLANSTWAGSLIRLRDGRFAIAGYVSSNVDYCAMIALFDAAGKPVRSFGDNGFALFDSLDKQSQINQLVEMPDGNILGIGSATSKDFIHRGVLVCVDRKGKYAIDFNKGRPVLTSYSDAVFGIQWTAGMLREGGRIVVLSSTHGEEDSEIVIAQFKSDGSADPDFADDGVLVINLTGVLDMAGGLAIQNKQIVVSGTSLPRGGGVGSFAFRCADKY